MIILPSCRARTTTGAGTSSPLARISSLEDLTIRGRAPVLYGMEDVWMAGGCGKVLLPEDPQLLNDAGKPTGRYT